MWSLGTLHALNDKIHDKAERKNKKPKVLTPAAIAKSPPFKIPNLNGYCPTGWFELQRWRAAKMPSFDKLSMGPDEIRKTMEEWVERQGHKSLGWAICEEGEYQLYFASYLKLQETEGFFWGLNDDVLVIQLDEERRQKLADQLSDTPEYGADHMMRAILSPLVDNTDLVWIGAEETGDLTAAPLLGLLGEVTSENDGPFGARAVDGGYRPIESRWGFADYQIISPQEVLGNDGEVVFHANW